MQFRNFAENLLGSKIKIKLLKHILSEEAITSEREIARLLNVSAGAVNKTLKEFHELNLITPMRIGNVTAWRLNEKSYAYAYLQDFFSKLKNREEPVCELEQDIRKMAHNSEIKRVILFGSVAEGRELPESDIDVFFLLENEKSRARIQHVINKLGELCVQKYGNVLSIHDATQNEMKKKKKFYESMLINGRMVIEK